MRYFRLVKFIILIGMLPVFFLGCRDTDFEERESQLSRREKDLTHREKEFEKKEAEYESLLILRDSLRVSKDTERPMVWPDSIRGFWSSKLLCRASGCTNYVVGDQRTDTWEFAADSTGIFVHIINKDTIVRTFTGKIEEQQISLHYQLDSIMKYPLKIDITLQQESSNIIKGTQTTYGADNCKAEFSVELIKDTKR